MITLEEIIIRRGDIEKICRSNTSLGLWRAVLKDGGSLSNPLYPDLAPRQLPNGDIRVDVDVFIDPKSGIQMVRCQEGKGTSLAGSPAIFGTNKWDYIVIPAGTKIPVQLVITKDYFMPRKKCWHYSISPNFDMPKQVFLNALDQLARNARITLKGKKIAKY